VASPASPDQLDEARRFIARVGKDAHAYGASVPRIESYLDRLARTFGLRGGFLAWPHHMLVVLQDDRIQRQQVDVERFGPSSVALDKLARLGSVVDEVTAGTMNPTQAVGSLDDIAKAPSPWDTRAVGVAYATIGLAIAVVLNGSWLDAVLGAALALVVFGILVATARFGARWAAWLPLVTAFVPAAIATALRHWNPDINGLVVTIAAIVVLLPGFGISIGVGELIEDHVIAGWTSLLKGLVYLAKQVLGVWLGVGLVNAIVDPPRATSLAPVPDVWLWLLIPLLIIGLCVVFQTSRRDFGWACLNCGLAYTISLVAGNLLGVYLGTVVAAAVVTVTSNLWGIRTRRPTSIVLLPAFVILVSGIVGFQGLAAIVEGATETGAQEFLQMFVIAVMITGGFLVGNTIVRPGAAL
jgi:uncharacterized membrane protein YjjP (DUF1212 family)